MSVAEVKALREQRGQLYAQMQDLCKTARTENRGLNPEEKTTFDALDKQQDALRERIETEDRLAELGSEDAARRDLLDRQDREATRRDLATSKDARMAFLGWALGNEFRTDKHEQAAKKCGISLRGNYDLRFLDTAPRTLAALGTMVRATTSPQAIGDSTLGGNVVPNEPMVAIERALLAFGGMRGVSRVIRTETGATLPIPTVNDTTNAAVIIAESSNQDVNNVQFGQITMTAHKYSSRFVQASIEFMQDNNLNFGSWIGDILGERMARGTNSHFTTGSTDGTQPYGAVTEALSSTQHQITYDGLVNLLHRLDPAYRSNASWMFHDTVLRRIRNIVDTQGLPIWQPGLTAGEPDRILGYPFVVNQNCNTDNTLTTTKQLVFGDFSKYLIRDVMDVQLRRLDERFAEFAQVAFLTLSRHDGRTLIASTVNPPIVAQIPTS